MSDIQVTTEFTVNTAQADSAITAHTAKLQAEAAKWRAMNVDIDVRLKPPDVTAIQRLARYFTANPLEIPVRFVPQGSQRSPIVTPQTVEAAERMRGGTVSNAGPSVALSNGRPGVDPQGFSGAQASYVPPTSARSPQAAPDVSSAASVAAVVGEMPALQRTFEGIREGFTDVISELSDFARNIEGINAQNRARAQQEYTRRSSRRQDAGDDEPAEATAEPERGGIYDIAGDYELRPNRRPQPRGPTMDDELGARATEAEGGDAEFRRFIENPQSASDNGYNGNWTAPAAAAETPTGGVTRSARLGGLGRAFSALGGIYAVESGLRTAVSYGNAGYGLRGGERMYAQSMAADEGLRSIPIAGQLGGAYADFASATTNYLAGGSFVTDNRIAEETRRQAQLQDEAGGQRVSAHIAANVASTYNVPDATEIQRRGDLVGLAYQLQKDFTDPNTGKLSGAGTSLLEARRNQINTEAWRKTDEYNRNQWTATDVGDVENQATRRRGDVMASQANQAYDRSAELADKLATIDEGTAKERASIKYIPEGTPERANAEAKLTADEEAAKQEKIKATYDLKKQWAMEDASLQSSIDANTLRASGDTYDADVTEFKRASDLKIQYEQDAGKKQQMIREQAAILAAKDYELVADARQRTEGVSARERVLGGDAYGAAQQQIEDAARERAIKNGTYDQKSGQYLDTNGINPATGLPFTEGQKAEADATDRDKRQSQAELNRGRQNDLSDIAAQARESRLRSNGQSGKADLDALEHQIGIRLQAVLNDPDKLKAELDRSSAQLQEFAMGQQHGEIFGSVSSFLSDRLEKSLNQDGSANDAAALSKQLSAAEKLDAAGGALSTAAASLAKQVI